MGIKKMWSVQGAVLVTGTAKGLEGESLEQHVSKLKLERNTVPGHKFENGRKDQKQHLKCSFDTRFLNLQLFSLCRKRTWSISSCLAASQTPLSRKLYRSARGCLVHSLLSFSFPAL